MPPDQSTPKALADIAALRRRISDIERAHGVAPEPPGPPPPGARQAEIVAEASGIAMLIEDPDGTIRFATRATGALLGTLPDGLVGQNWWALVHPDDVAAVASACSAPLDRTGIELGFRIRRSDGTYLRAGVQRTPIEHEGSVAQFLLSLREASSDRLAAGAPVDPADRSRPGDAFLAISDEGRILSYNRAFRELFALPEEVLAAGDHDAAVRIAATRVADSAAFQAARDRDRTAPEGAYTDEVRLADGRVLERSSAPAVDREQRRIGRFVFYRDVTSRRRAEEDVQARMRQQAAVTRVSQLAISAERVDVLLDGSVALAANALATDIGVFMMLDAGTLAIAASVGIEGEASPPVSAAGTSLAALALWSGAPVVVADLVREAMVDDALLTGAKALSAAAVLVRDRAQPRGVLVVASRSRARFAADEVHFLQTIANVIGAALERLEADAFLRDRQRVFGAIFESALDGMIITDEVGRLTHANAAAEALLGAGEALLGRPLAAFLKGARGPAEEQVRALWRADRARGELHLQTLRGEARLAEYAAVANILPGRHLVVLRDVTDRQQIQARLALADRMASVGTLAAGVAHELNNPLAYVTTNVRFAAENAAEPDVVEALREAAEGAERMKLIIRDLRTFARGAEDADGRVDLCRVLDSCMKMTWNEIKHRAQLEPALDGGLPLVRGSEARLAQVFVNLLMNAAQAIPEGDSKRHRIRVAVRRWHDGRIAVEIADTGSGIAPEHLPRVFDPFFTTKDPGVGTGLGLSICHNIVADHGGEIEVTSEPGRGTTFRVLLPAAAADGRPAPPPSRAAPAERRSRILVVDDEPLVGRSLQRTLSPWHEVVVVERAKEALERVHSGERFDLVVSDLLMPEMSGADLQNRLAERWPDLARRMIFVTGGAFTPATRAFIESGAATVLEKPFEVDRLREVIASHLAEAGPPGLP